MQIRQESKNARRASGFTPILSLVCILPLFEDNKFLSIYSVSCPYFNFQKYCFIFSIEKGTDGTYKCIWFITKGYETRIHILHLLCCFRMFSLFEGHCMVHMKAERLELIDGVPVHGEIGKSTNLS